MGGRGTLLLLFVLPAALCGCGSGGGESSGRTAAGTAATAAESARVATPPRQLLREAGAALADARSFALHARGDAQGHRTRIVLEVEDPEKVRLELEQGARLTKIVMLGAHGYMAANAAELSEAMHTKLPAAFTDALAGRWLEIPSAQAKGSLTGLQQRRLGRCLAAERGTMVAGGLTKAGGQAAVRIIDKGDVAGSTPSTFFVAATGKPWLLRDVQTGRERPGGPGRGPCRGGDEPWGPGAELTLSRYEDALNIGAPVGAVTPRKLIEQLTGR